MEYEDEYYLEEDKLGMTVTAGSVTLPKNDSNLIGISIGGGGKYCPCLYVVQVFDNTAASREGTLQSGDEITGVNTVNVKGKSKTEVAQLIQRSTGDVTIHYNKLHPDPKQGKSLDIALKKVKHRLVESLSSSTADALGLSRAILCNDALVKKLDDLSQAEQMYRALIDHAKLVFKAFFDLIQVYKKFGDVFCGIGVRELQQSANEAFNQFGEAHRTMEKYGIQMLKRLKPILGDLGTYLHKAIPDTRLTIKRYADVKFEYLSYCLKVKEMDDEEIQFTQLQEPLYRVETGNYEYRLVLRCRQEARASFARLRSDVLVKLELLDSKHVQHLTSQLTRLVSLLAAHHTQCQQLMHDKHWFPIELDLAGTTLWRAADDDSSGVQEYHDEEEEEETTEDTNDLDDNLLDAEEATEEDLDVGASNNHLSDVTNEQLLLGQLEGLSLEGDFSTLNGDSTAVMGLTAMQGTTASMAPLIPSDMANFGSGAGSRTPSAADAGNQSMMQQNMMGVQQSNMMSGQQNMMNAPQNMMNAPQNMMIGQQNMMGGQQNNMMGVQQNNMMSGQQSNMMGGQQNIMMGVQQSNMMNMTGGQHNSVMLPIQQSNMMSMQNNMMQQKMNMTPQPQCDGNSMPQPSMMSFSQAMLSPTGMNVQLTINDSKETSSSLLAPTLPSSTVSGMESKISADLSSTHGSLPASSSEKSGALASKTGSGLSQLSQELMSGDPFDVDKQIEGFTSPCKASATNQVGSATNQAGSVTNQAGSVTNQADSATNQADSATLTSTAAAVSVKDVPLLQASEELDSFLCGPDASTETVTASGDNDASVGKEKTEPKDKQEDMEDVSLLDGF